MKSLPRCGLSLLPAISIFSVVFELTPLPSEETLELFYHGYDNYLVHAFPEDELKPVSCQPLTRDRANPSHIEVNDVLGNYSLTLVDSLSTLAILASSDVAGDVDHDPLMDFQDGISAFVELYGDGTSGPDGLGSRSRGFDLDSKVQVFETVIRGVGGLLSAHLFAIGELPIRGYNLEEYTLDGDQFQLRWPSGFVYNGQLLRLAKDLADRLLPAFHTVTGLPYPRVNLRHGVPFYPNSPLNWDSEGLCEENESSKEITETCTAGAGSLVLEFTVLSRLLADDKYEIFARRAFFAVWERRTDIGLLGAGIDAESGNWVAPYTGIGAGVDSFFEYAVKSHVLLSGLADWPNPNSSAQDPDFLDVWYDAHAGIRRHLYRDAAYQHPHYVQGDVYTGATRAFWMDSLSAFYPGLLTLSGQLEEAIQTHMLFAALWSRYSALPERWNVATGNVDQGLKWWPGRPEFIESTWYLYRATQDPWYLHVSEMVLKDINLRCKTECGWAGLEDVRQGLLKDRMESFFLGETAKYLYLTFDPSHPLNHFDAPFVFSTEGHPLIIPRKGPSSRPLKSTRSRTTEPQTCPLPPTIPAMSGSAIAARDDYFHAANLARLQHVPFHGLLTNETVESSLQDYNVATSNRFSPNSFSYYPWTLPLEYTPVGGWCSLLESRVTFDLSFPTIPNAVSGPLTLRRIAGGVTINSISGLKLSMIQEEYEEFAPESGLYKEEVFRIHALSHLLLGRDETVTIANDLIAELNPVDPYFTRHRDAAVLDLVVDSDTSSNRPSHQQRQNASLGSSILDNVTLDLEGESSFSGWLSQLSSFLEAKAPLESMMQTASAILKKSTSGAQPLHIMEGSISTGPGAAPIPDIADAALQRGGALPWQTIYFSDETCVENLPGHVAKEYQIIVMKRGGCTFSEKLKRIPMYAPSRTALQLVIVVSYPELEDPEEPRVRPFLDQVQQSSSGVVRLHQIPFVMVEGGDAAYALLKSAQGIGIRRRYHFSSQGLRINNLFVV